MPTSLLNNHTLTDVRPTVNVRQLSVCLAYITSFPGPHALSVATKSRAGPGNEAMAYICRL